MGFFSWDCKACGHPLLSHYVLENDNKWMNRGVALTNDGSVLKGEYDGYGRLNDHEIGDGDPEVYHEACWKLIGKPTDKTGPSRSSSDQGYFYGDDVHNFPEPENEKDIKMIKVAADLNDQITCNEWEIERLKSIIFQVADAYDSKNNKEIEEATKELIKYRDIIKKREEEERAKKLGLEVKLMKEIEDVIQANSNKNSLAYLSIKKVEVLEFPVFRVFMEEDMYQEINLEDASMGKQKYTYEDDFEDEKE